MAFSPSVVGCLVKKRLAKAGVTGTPGPPWLRPRESRIIESANVHADANVSTKLIC